MTGSNPSNPIKYNLPFLIKAAYVIYLQNDTSIVELTYNDIKRFSKPCIWLCDNVIMRFLRWTSLQSYEKAVVDSLSYQKKKLDNRPSTVIRQSINSRHLIISPLCQHNFWYTFMFIRLELKKYMLIQLYSLKSKVRILRKVKISLRGLNLVQM